jgi:predicted DsbA family dithiol-disulfide isomerase
MPRRIEVFADITCPFTHVGLKRVVALLDELGAEVELVVRAWPLEWVNGEMFTADAIAMKIGVLRDQLGVEDFVGFDPDRWPATSIPALNLCAAAYRQGQAEGLAVALAVRAALFDDGADVSDPGVLAEIADAHGLEAPRSEPDPDVSADYEEGQRRGVRGSPDFWIGENEFFCPALELTHDETGALVAHFDPEGLDAFVAAAVGQGAGGSSSAMS